VSLNAVSELPVTALPHRADASKVEDWQYQLWLGLRAVTSATGKPLQVPADVISQTLNLWRCNLEESSIDPDSAEHQVNQSIVAWLEICLSGSLGLLPPGA